MNSVAHAELNVNLGEIAANRARSRCVFCWRADPSQIICKSCVKTVFAIITADQPINALCIHPRLSQQCQPSPELSNGVGFEIVTYCGAPLVRFRAEIGENQLLNCISNLFNFILPVMEMSATHVFFSFDCWSNAVSIQEWRVQVNLGPAPVAKDPAVHMHMHMRPGWR